MIAEIILFAFRFLLCCAISWLFLIVLRLAFQSKPKPLTRLDYCMTKEQHALRRKLFQRLFH
jgi:hypothetical protein